MTRSDTLQTTSVGVLALQGAFDEHIQLLRQAAVTLGNPKAWYFFEVRTAAELERCDALIIPGGESTAISLLADRSGLLGPLREFVKVKRRPVWGTCAGLILLAESANRTKRGGQELIGGLDVLVNRNHFGRQVESFEAEIDMSFLGSKRPFHTVFIRAPIVERVLTEQTDQNEHEVDIVRAPSAQFGSATKKRSSAPVEILARLPPQAGSLDRDGVLARDVGEDGDIVAVRQGNVFGTAFHPELTGDARIHEWWLGQVAEQRLIEAQLR